MKFMSHGPPLTRPLVMTLIAIALLAGTLANGADGKKSLKKKPDTDAGPELIQPEDAEEGAPEKPAKPKSKVKISADAQSVLDEVAAAYKKVDSLRLVGSIDSDLDVAGEQRQHHAAFEASFQAPFSFRHLTREGERGKETDADLFGSTGEKLFVFNSPTQNFQLADAPKKRTTGDQLGKPFNQMLEQQNPSLLMAISEDPATELMSGVKSIEKVDDQKIDDTSCPALKLTGDKGASTILVIDPGTHLLRRIIDDLKPDLEQRGTPEVKKATITTDYSTIELGADLKKEQFAWAPPEGAKDGSKGTVAMAGDLEDAPALTLEGKAAPDFTLKDAEGKDVTLAALRGNVVVLDFWATWCGPCRESLPHLDALYSEKKGDSVKVFAINLQEPDDKVAEFVATTKLSIPVLFDSDGKVAEKYLVSPIPQTVVISKDGTIKKVLIGAGPESADTLKKVVEEAMK